MGDGKSFTVAARAVFNGVVSMHRDKQSCQEVGGGLPLPFQSSDDGRLLGAFLLGGSPEASGWRGVSLPGWRAIPAGQVHPPTQLRPVRTWMVTAGF